MHITDELIIEELSPRRPGHRLSRRKKSPKIVPRAGIKKIVQQLEKLDWLIREAPERFRKKEAAELKGTVLYRVKHGDSDPKKFSDKFYQSFYDLKEILPRPYGSARVIGWSHEYYKIVEILEGIEKMVYAIAVKPFNLDVPKG